MAPCCNNTVTPRMIKAGNVSVGDRIQLEETSVETAAEAAAPKPDASPASAIPDHSQVITSAKVAALLAANAAAASATSAETDSSSAEASSEVSPVSASTDSEASSKSDDAVEASTEEPAKAVASDNIAGIPGGIHRTPLDAVRPQGGTQGGTQGGSSSGTQRGDSSAPRDWYDSVIYGVNAAKENQNGFTPLPYSAMTEYMNNISLGGTPDSPSIITPQAPMTPNGFDEEIDYESVQAFNGFLRTQIGRYMRIEQLIGSNTIEDRFGFLVGVGTNFIILQEITTGNIMVIDIFSIRLTYVYYSPPVLPHL